MGTNTSLNSSCLEGEVKGVLKRDKIKSQTRGNTGAATNTTSYSGAEKDTQKAQSSWR